MLSTRSIRSFFGLPSAVQRAAVRSAGDDDLPLPPRALRRGAPEHRDDRDFIESARRDVRTLIDRAGLAMGSRLLEIGCGPGRLAIGLLSLGFPIGRYEGLDVDPGAIDWCQRWIASRHGAYAFHHVDIRDERRNPRGEIRLEDRFRFAWRDRCFDVIYADSVFMRMQPGDVRVYLAEIRRLLSPGGLALINACLERDLPEAGAPAGRGGPRAGLRLVRFEEGCFRAMLAEHGLAVVRCDRGAEDDGRSALVLARAEEIEAPEVPLAIAA